MSNKKNSSGKSSKKQDSESFDEEILEEVRKTLESKKSSGKKEDSKGKSDKSSSQENAEEHSGEFEKNIEKGLYKLKQELDKESSEEETDFEKKVREETSEKDNREDNETEEQEERDTDDKEKRPVYLSGTNMELDIDRSFFLNQTLKPVKLNTSFLERSLQNVSFNETSNLEENVSEAPLENREEERQSYLAFDENYKTNNKYTVDNSRPNEMLMPSAKSIEDFTEERDYIVNSNMNPIIHTPETEPSENTDSAIPENKVKHPSDIYKESRRNSRRNSFKSDFRFEEADEGYVISR